MPLVFERWSMRANVDVDTYLKKISKYDGCHLFIFQHGLGGNASQFRFFRNIVKIAVPNCKMLSCVSNEDKTEKTDITEMGKNLASEVLDYLDALSEEDASFQLGRITFVCHSLGGLISRAALPHLSMLKDKMYGFFSISVPHLGAIGHQKPITKVGLFILKKTNHALSQLSLSDARKYEDTKVFQLASDCGLSWFRHLVLVSSHQDGYVPYDSARIQAVE